MCKENISEYNPMELWLKLIDAETEEDLAELEMKKRKNNHCIA